MNLGKNEQRAIEELDRGALHKAIAEAIDGDNLTALRDLQLHNLGSYVLSAERQLETKLDKKRKAKSAKKVALADYEVRRAGLTLESAIDQMKERAKREREDGQYFYVEDHIIEPLTLRPNMTISVSYRWRTDKDKDWMYGRVSFNHTYDASRHQAAVAERKLNSRKQEEELQELLRQEWRYLHNLAIFSVRDFFREGGDGSDIPTSFDAVPDRGSLNNFSLKFWDGRDP